MATRNVLLLWVILFTVRADKTVDEISDLQQEVQKLKEMLTKSGELLDKQVTNLQNEINFLKQDEITKTSVKRQVPDAGGIAFYSQLTNDMPRLGDHQRMVYDDVVTNMGAAYNKNDGIFTAPVAGVYVFSWATTNADHSYMNTELVHNVKVVGKAMSDAMDHADYAVATNVAVLQLQPHDEVWVRTGTWHNGHVRGSAYTTFSGFLLYPTKSFNPSVIG